MQDVHVILNPWLLRQKQNSTRWWLFPPATELTVKEETSEVINLEYSFYNAETWTLRKVDQKYLESFWKHNTGEKKVISWTDRVRKVIQRVKEERNILQTIKWSKTKWTGDILRWKCLPKYVTEGKTEGMIEVTGRRRRRRKNILGDLQETRGCWKMKAEALGSTLWKTRFGRGYGCVLRETTEWINESIVTLNKVINTLSYSG